MLQTGYLTINKISKIRNTLLYYLITPNSEVNEDYNELIKNILPDIINIDVHKESEKVFKAILNRNTTELEDIFMLILERISYYQHANQRNNEFFYQSILFTYCCVLFSDSRMEEPGAEGTPDMFLALSPTAPKKCAICELKYDSGESLKNSKNYEKRADTKLNSMIREALKAIRTKRYGQRYALEGYETVKIAVAILGRAKVRVRFYEEPAPRPAGPNVRK
jgi:hypothetical protein